MFFYKEENDIDFGETTIPNIFIDIYMPMGDGLYTKVYLLAYRQVCSSIPDPKFDNRSIARILEVPLSDVINAWKFWENKSIVKMHKNDSPDDFDYSIEFLDLKRLYVENLQTNTTSIKSNSDRIVSAGENPSITKMFNSIQRIVGRFIDPSEKLRILDIREKFNLSPDIIVYAYEVSKQKNNGVPKTLNYIEGILRNWYDLGLDTLDDIKNNIFEDRKRYDMYRSIFKVLGYSKDRNILPKEKEFIDKWLDDYNMDIEIILEACTKINIPYPSIQYLDGIIENYRKNNVETLDDVKKLDEEYKLKKQQSKNRYYMYKSIFKELGYRSDRDPTAEEKRIMNKWFDDYGMDIEVILEACTKSKNTKTPTVSYIDGIIENYVKNNVKTLDDIKKLEEEFNQKKQHQKNTSSNNNSIPKVKTRFHNINERFRNYTPDELEKLLKESQKGKF